MKTLRDPISSVTHLIGGFLSILVTVLFMVKQIFSEEFHGTLFASIIIFGLALCLLYLTSGIYHAISATKVKYSYSRNYIAKKIFHLLHLLYS